MGNKEIDNKEIEEIALEDMTLEQTFAAVEEVITHLQNDSLPLEESFGYYQEGLKLLKKSNEYIDNIEKQIIVLSKEDRQDGV